MTTRRYALRDEQWERIRDLLPGREGHVEVTASYNRLFVEAVLYRYRAGIPGQDLPSRFGDLRVVHTRFSRWAKTGSECLSTWQKMLITNTLRIDSTIVARPSAQRGGKGGKRAKSHWLQLSSD